MKITNVACVLALLSPSFGADVDPPRGARGKRHPRGLQAHHPHDNHPAPACMPDLQPGYECGMVPEMAGLWVGEDKWYEDDVMWDYCSRVLWNPANGRNFLTWNGAYLGVGEADEPTSCADVGVDALGKTVAGGWMPIQLPSEALILNVEQRRCLPASQCDFDVLASGDFPGMTVASKSCHAHLEVDSFKPDQYSCELTQMNLLEDSAGNKELVAVVSYYTYHGGYGNSTCPSKPAYDAALLQSDPNMVGMARLVLQANDFPAPYNVSHDPAGWGCGSAETPPPPAPMNCDGALEAFLQLTEPSDNDIFVGANSSTPVPGDSYNWAENRLCAGNDNADCSDPIGSAYGMWTYLPGDDTYMTDEYYILGEYGSLTLTSIEYPGSAPHASVTAGTGCFAGLTGLTGQMTAIYVKDENYYNYDLSAIEQPPADLCDGALENFLQLTEPSDTDIFVGANESSPVPGDSYNWAGNRLCAGNDNANCSDPIGSAYGMYTYLPDDDTFITDEYYILGEYGSLTLTSIEYPGATPYASVTGGTGCFAGLTGQMTAIYVEDEDYYNYDLSALVRQPPAETTTSQPELSSDECDAALETFLQLTEPFDNDIFVGSDADSPVPGDSENWARNRLCLGNDNANCSDPIGSAYGMSTYLPGNETYVTDEFYVLGEYGTLALTSIEYPDSTPYAFVTGGTGCFAGASGQTTAIVVGDDEYYNYDLSGVVLQSPPETPPVIVVH